jgi:hypothetical protein
VSSHYSEDDLTLYYYGEGRRRAAIEMHLENCAQCAALYREIAGTLALIAAPEAPERGEQYGLEVWQRIRQDPRFTGFEKFTGFTRFRFWFANYEGLALAGAAAVLILAAFLAGRTWTSSPAPTTAVNVTNPATPEHPANPANPANQILLTAVADHLESSERVLTDLLNAPDTGGANRREDISAEQRWAEDLLATSRLYRQDALEAGERSVASVLDDLERSLLEIVHSPSKIASADLEQLRRRIDAAALLFKVRVMSDELRRRESAPADRPSPRATTASTSKVS